MVIRNGLMASFTYRAHMLFQILGSVVGIVVLWFLWSAIFAAAGTPTVHGMTFGQTFLYVALATALFVMMRTWIEWDMNAQIRTGDIVVHFFRPYNYTGWSLTSSLGFVAGNMITITLPSLITIFLVFHAPLPPLLNIVLFVPALIQAYLLSFLIDFAVGITAFHTESIWGVSASKESIVLFLSGGLVPLAFFPEQVKNLLLWLPFASMFNTPIALLASAITDLGQIGFRLALQTVWVVALWLVVRWYYNSSVKRLTVAGG